MNRLLELKCPNCLDYHIPSTDLVVSSVEYYEEGDKFTAEFTVTLYCPKCDSNIYDARIETVMEESNLTWEQRQKKGIQDAKSNVQRSYEGKL